MGNSCVKPQKQPVSLDNLEQSTASQSDEVTSNTLTSNVSFSNGQGTSSREVTPIAPVVIANPLESPYRSPSPVMSDQPTSELNEVFEDIGRGAVFTSIFENPNPEHLEEASVSRSRSQIVNISKERLRPEDPFSSILGEAKKAASRVEWKQGLAQQPENACFATVICTQIGYEWSMALTEFKGKYDWLLGDDVAEKLSISLDALIPSALKRPHKIWMSNLLNGEVNVAGHWDNFFSGMLKRKELQLTHFASGELIKVIVRIDLDATRTELSKGKDVNQWFFNAYLIEHNNLTVDLDRQENPTGNINPLMAKRGLTFSAEKKASLRSVTFSMHEPTGTLTETSCSTQEPATKTFGL